MAFKLEKIQNLFPIPLLTYSVGNHQDLDRRLLKEITKRRKTDRDIANTNRRGWQSIHDLFVRTEPAHSEIAEILRKATFHALHSVATEVKADKLHLTMNGWVNVNPPGGYIGPHCHPQALLSGAYYVSVPEDEGDGGSIEFVASHAVGHLSGWIHAPMLVDKVKVKPLAGTILMFPSQLKHWVLPNNSNDDRVTIAFNLSARLKAGAFG